MPESVALALYVALVSFGITHHVPWADESQAWMLAEQTPAWTLITHSLHYEGTPALWHLLLKLLQALHCSFTVARWVAGGIATAGVVVLLARAPFPRLLRLLLPFSFFLAYQDAVIARSYVLFAVLAFAAAALLRSHHPRPLRLALILALMAHISLHALLASIGLALAAAGHWRARLLRNAPAVTLLLAAWLFAAATLAPARDVDFSAGNNVRRALARVERQLGFHAEPPPMIATLPLAGLPRVPLPVHARSGAQGAWNKLARTLAVITFPISTSRVLALLLVACIVAQAFRPADGRETGALGAIGLVPYLLLVAVFTSLYLEPRHTGIVFTTLLVTAWLTWPGYPLQLARLTTILFTLAVCLQISWTLHALAAERSQPYSPDRETAAYLHQHHAGEPGHSAAGFYYYSAGPLLYFDRNPYLNQPPQRAWSWSTGVRTYTTVEAILAKRPELIVVGGYQAGPEAEITRDWRPNTPPEPGVRYGDYYRVADYFRAHGYRDDRLFCGHSWMRDSYTEMVCQQVLARNAP